MAAIENSVIVPAYHEKLNIKPLTTRLFAALGNEFSKTTELIFVDDNSQDGSVEEVDKLHKNGYNVRIIVRTDERGLSSAVLRGFYEAKGEYLVCMDADLQHPPESVPQLLEKLRNYPFVLGTRYAPGVGIDKDWPLHRRIISNGARCLAKPLTSASDPMSGFFGLQKKYLLEAPKDSLNAEGFKVALDLMVKLPLPPKDPIGEVPFSFGVRTEGESKLSGKVIVQYLVQLKELYIYRFGAANLLTFIVIWSVLIMYLLFVIYSSLF
ncbi:probable Dolichol-phosphate mannosyltransferase [Saccharomycodes ludwigii]|uniref:Dolichol-phosphate mannosyltransferase subunit 1 n=1 Tax=Saccharomycodes ludwigii TaxID=36035 RepID=A0A376BA74_9ASCO|nr:hypothetical protein SCDLUD_000020 [Saccharomycodes ludwigii]KAH3902443.1 hypothetical protein SCDLUD_000020 [Saccharomycodes ludwigii]SSD61501.1 probable Dolichol-phosphate mannosyltransferase [Saccharomycodes ludwigii]